MRSVKDYINLLPRVEKKPLRLMSNGLFPGLLITLMVLGMFGWQAKRQWVLKDRLAALTAQKQAIRQQADAIRTKLGIPAGGTGLGKAALIQSLLEERVLWSEVFRQFSQIVPKGLWFDGLEGSTAGIAQIRIKGGAFSYLSISDFMASMERSGYFENPQLSYAQKAVVQGQEVVGFEIICGIKKTGGAR